MDFGTPARSSACACRAAIAASSNPSISSAYSFDQFSCARSRRKTPPSPIALRSISTNSRGGVTPPSLRSSRWTRLATSAP